MAWYLVVVVVVAIMEGILDVAWRGTPLKLRHQADAGLGYLMDYASEHVVSADSSRSVISPPASRHHCQQQLMAIALRHASSLQITSARSQRISLRLDVSSTCLLAGPYSVYPRSIYLPFILSSRNLSGTCRPDAKRFLCLLCQRDCICI